MACTGTSQCWSAARPWLCAARFIAHPTVSPAYSFHSRRDDLRCGLCARLKVMSLPLRCQTTLHVDWNVAVHVGSSMAMPLGFQERRQKAFKRLKHGCTRGNAMLSGCFAASTRRKMGDKRSQLGRKRTTFSPAERGLDSVIPIIR